MMSWSRDVSVSTDSIKGSSTIEIEHPSPWKRLSRYELGDLISHDGEIWESQTNANFNRRPGHEGDYWKKIPSDYNVEREDWNIKSNSIENKIFFLAPDGVLFNERNLAEYAHKQNFVQFQNL